MGFIAVKSVFDMYDISPIFCRVNKQFYLPGPFLLCSAPPFPPLFTLPFQAFHRPSVQWRPRRLTNPRGLHFRLPQSILLGYTIFISHPMIIAYYKPSKSYCIHFQFQYFNKTNRQRPESDFQGRVTSPLSSSHTITLPYAAQLIS